MTYNSHMETINVASLKSTLSTILKRVREGERLIVVNRDTPIATLNPYQETEIKIAKKAVDEFSAPKGISCAKKITNPLLLLREDRDRR